MISSFIVKKPGLLFSLTLTGILKFSFLLSFCKLRFCHLLNIFWKKQNNNAEGSPQKTKKYIVLFKNYFSFTEELQKCREFLLTAHPDSPIVKILNDYSTFVTSNEQYVYIIINYTPYFTKISLYLS